MGRGELRPATDRLLRTTGRRKPEPPGRAGKRTELRLGSGHCHLAPLRSAPWLRGRRRRCRPCLPRALAAAGASPPLRTKQGRRLLSRQPQPQEGRGRGRRYWRPEGRGSGKQVHTGQSILLPQAEGWAAAQLVCDELRAGALVEVVGCSRPVPRTCPSPAPPDSPDP